MHLLVLAPSTLGVTHRWGRVVCVSRIVFPAPRVRARTRRSMSVFVHVDRTLILQLHPESVMRASRRHTHGTRVSCRLLGVWPRSKARMNRAGCALPDWLASLPPCGAGGAGSRKRPFDSYTHERAYGVHM